MKISQKTEVSDDDIKDLLTTAFEGGVGYWCVIDHYTYAPGIEAKDFTVNEEAGHVGKFNSEENYHHPCQIIPLIKGCAVVCVDNGEPVKEHPSPWILNRKAIERGFKLMPKLYPKHWADFISENYDANTADVFLQLCFFGELIYG